jgi:hypothetical protein
MVITVVKLLETMAALKKREATPSTGIGSLIVDFGDSLVYSTKLETTVPLELKSTYYCKVVDRLEIFRPYSS